MEPVREGRRAAARLVLAALAAALVILVLAAASKWRYVALAAALVTAVVSGWYAVSRRGLPRLLAVLAGLAAVGILLGSLVLDPPLVFETHPAALRLRLPRSVKGRPLRERAAHVASRSTVHELASVVAGTTREE